LHDWSETLHARAGVNCNACHIASPESGWQDKVSHETCAKCHDAEVAGWLQGRHGMRVAQGLPPMTPAEARLPMKSGRAHEQLDCSSCHGGHRFDTQTAAVDTRVPIRNPVTTIYGKTRRRGRALRERAFLVRPVTCRAVKTKMVNPWSSTIKMTICVPMRK